MKKPTVSVVIPAYNTSEAVKNVINGVLEQSFEDFEVILVNDGSTDNTLEVLKSYQEKDKRIRVFSKKNSGAPSGPRNFGIGKVRGKYIQFFDSDDRIASKDALKKAVEAMNERDLVATGWTVDLETKDKIIRDYKKVSPERELITKDITNYVLKSIGSTGLLYNIWNKLFRTSIIKKNNIKFRENLPFGEDLLFVLDYLKYVKSIQIIPDITYGYFTSNISGTFSKSSLVPEYRHINNQALDDFIGDSPSQETKDLADWVKWRWLLSYWMRISQADLPLSEKIQRIKDGPGHKQLTAVKKPHHIGDKRYLMIRYANLLLKSPSMALLVAKTASKSKQVTIKIKSSLRK